MQGRILALDRNEYFCHHHPEVLAALRLAPENASTYASQQAHSELRQKIAELISAPQECVTLGHGGEDLLVKILVWQRRFASKLVRLDFSWQTYVEIAQGLDFDVISVPVQETGAQFCTPLERFDALLATLRDRAVVILNSPNNPTGHGVDAQRVFFLAEAHPNHVFILDGVYDVPRSKHVETALKLNNVIFVGSFSKFFGMPGVRVGYAVATSLPRAFQPILGLPHFAIEACSRAIRHHEHYLDNRHQMLSFAGKLFGNPCPSATIFRSDAPFVLSRITKGPSNISERIEMLIQEFGVQPKILTQANETYLRWGLAQPEVNARILSFMEKL
jgi:histidinol-phosphate/aromatic aminotransferase/cobyric acid decarboxylase-like protein